MSVERRNFVLREIYRMLKKVTDLEVTPLTKEQERKIVNLLSEVVVEQGFMTAEEYDMGWVVYSATLAEVR